MCKSNVFTKNLSVAANHSICLGCKSERERESTKKWSDFSWMWRFVARSSMYLCISYRCIYCLHDPGVCVRWVSNSWKKSYDISGHTLISPVYTQSRIFIVRAIWRFDKYKWKREYHTIRCHMSQDIKISAYRTLINDKQNKIFEWENVYAFMFDWEGFPMKFRSTITWWLFSHIFFGWK